MIVVVCLIGDLRLPWSGIISVTREPKSALKARAALPGTVICAVTAATAAEAGWHGYAAKLSATVWFRRHSGNRHVARTTGTASER